MLPFHFVQKNFLEAFYLRTRGGFIQYVYWKESATYFIYELVYHFI